MTKNIQEQLTIQYALYYILCIEYYMENGNDEGKQKTVNLFQDKTHRSFAQVVSLLQKGLCHSKNYYRRMS